MSKCRLIDMEAYSRGEIRIIGENEHEQKKAKYVPIFSRGLNLLTPEGLEDFAHFVMREHKHEPHGDICPHCGQLTLLHVEGCERCTACGYDKCNLHG